MESKRGNSWTARRRGSALALAVVVAAVALATAPVAAEEGTVDVIVRGRGEVDLQAIVERVGGVVERDLPILHGVAAVVPEPAVTTLLATHGVMGVTTDAQLQLLGDEWRADKDMGSFYMVTKAIAAHDVWGRSDSQGNKYTGQGIGVALLDSGVLPVEGLTVPGKVINGPDLSFESQAEHLRYLDTFGHGTHMAGIIAGRDSAVKPGNENDSKYFVGVAPGAHIVNLKLASADGSVDVSQVIAAIDWVVQHRNDPGLNIRVMNLSFGTRSTQPYELDPLAYAVEVAWRHGIVVVVAAGNEGSAGTLLNTPATDPFVIAVGGADHNGTEDKSDDSVATFSSIGNSTRAPDLVAPGRSIVSLRSPQSYLDQNHPAGRVAPTERFFRGSGTSQAAAVVSGAVALLLDERPNLTPDQVKYVLTRNAKPILGGKVAQGAGTLDLKDAQKIAPPAGYAQSFPRATGLGSLEQARGGSHVADPETGTELVGEQDIFGEPWNPATWAPAALEGASWSGGDWRGRNWSGASWSGASWSGASWSGASWSGASWSGASWSGRSWSSNTWNGASWSGASWSGASWSGASWSGASWSGRSWSDAAS